MTTHGSRSWHRRSAGVGARRLVAAGVVAALGLASVSARADTLCMTVDEFNTYMVLNDTFTTQATVSFTVTGIDPADFFNTKGCLADLTDGSCAGVASVYPKIYGPADPPNTVHGPGTVKQEYNDECCGQPSCPEGWAEPNPDTRVIFTAPSQVCDVTVYLDPLYHGFAIQCDGGTIYEGLGDNFYGIVVSEITLLHGNSGEFAMPNASFWGDEVCFEAATTGVLTTEVPVAEDVTASIAYPDQVYPEVTDLSSGADDSEIYLKFVVPPVDGLVTGARVFLRALPDSWASGSGGDLYAVDDNAWSESTLTWNDRPGYVGASLDRNAPINADQWYAFDVSGAQAITHAGGTFSFAVAPQADDTDGIHFHSKESSTPLAPYLLLEYEQVDADGDGHFAGPDCDDGAAEVHPGATELCNGRDDNCDGVVDEGCAGAPDAGVPAVDACAPGDCVEPDAAAPTPGDGATGSCDCRAGGSDAPVSTLGFGLLLALLLGGLRRRARR